MLEYTQPAVEFLTDPSVQAILNPLVQGVVALSVGWKFLCAAYVAVQKMFASNPDKLPAVTDAFAASLMDALDGECVLDTVKRREGNEIVEHPAILTDGPVTFIAYDDNVSAEALINGVDELPTVKHKRDRQRIAKRVHEVFDQLDRERDEDRRLDLACLVMGISEAESDELPLKGCQRDSSKQPVSKCDPNRMAEGSRVEPRRLVDGNGVPILSNAKFAPEAAKNVAWTAPRRKQVN